MENAYYILTPTASVPKNKVTDYKNLVQQLGSHSPDPGSGTARLRHCCSQSPPPYHCRLSGKSGAGQGFCGRADENDRCRRFHTSRASSSAAVWQQICPISTLLSSYIASSGDQQDEMPNAVMICNELFDSARIYRDSFINTASGPLKSSYAITIDIADEPGEIAAVATILALKNITRHVRPGVRGRGVLRIEFYQEEAIERSTKILCEKATVCTIPCT